MSSFADLQVQVRRTHKTSSVSVSGMEVAGSATTVLELTLPQACPLEASFCKEGLGHKLIKVFKKELQASDAEFDDAVYIATDTTEATAAWLGDDAVRKDLLELVETGGSVEIDGVAVRVELPGHTDDDDPTVVRLVRTLLPPS